MAKKRLENIPFQVMSLPLFIQMKTSVMEKKERESFLLKERY